MLRATARVHVRLRGSLARAHPGGLPDATGEWITDERGRRRRLGSDSIAALGTTDQAPSSRSRPTPSVGAIELRLDNGFGGFTAEGDYLIRVHGDEVPPAPWTNVIANPRAGFVVSERGRGFTWADNSYFLRLTPWHNDPVSDPPTETIYLRDDDTGRDLERYAGAGRAGRGLYRSARARHDDLHPRVRRASPRS